jgi:outer membrane protein TolC
MISLAARRAEPNRLSSPPMTLPLNLCAARWLLSLTLVAGGARSVEAQAAPTGRLTIDQALALAELHNPGYRQSTNDLELNAIERREAWLSILPAPRITVLQTGLSWNLQNVGTDPFGNPLPNPEARMVQSSTSQQRVAFGFNVDFRNYVTIRNRNANAEVREIDAANRLQSLRADVRRSFLAVQQQQLATQLEAELLVTEQQNQEIAERLFALARRERVDVLDAQLNVAQQEEALRQSHAALASALLALRNRIGDPTLQISEVMPVPFREVDPARIDEEALVRAALASSPAIVQQGAQIDAARRQASLVRGAQWLPTMSISANTGRSELQRGGGGAFFQPNPDGGWDRTVSIGLSLPDVGRHFDTQNALQRQQIQVRNYEEALRGTRLDVDQSVRTALVNLRAERASLALQEQTSAIAEERLQLRLEAYRLGRGTFLDLQTASSQAAQIRRALLTSRYNTELRLVDLEQTTGIALDRILELRTP